MDLKLEQSGGGFEPLRKALETIARKQVYVGIPEGKSGRSGGDISNAELMYVHTHGSALRGIPARPVIEPAIEATGNKELITGELGEAARAALDQNAGEVKTHLGNAGMLGRNAAIRWFTDGRNNWPPNSPATVAAKGSDRPLIDTGQLRRSITYIVGDE